VDTGVQDVVHDIYMIHNRDRYVPPCQGYIGDLSLSSGGATSYWN